MSNSYSELLTQLIHGLLYNIMLYDFQHSLILRKVSCLLTSMILQSVQWG